MGWSISRLLFSSSLLFSLSIGFRINPNFLITSNRDQKAFVLSRASISNYGSKGLCFFNFNTEQICPRLPTLFAKPKGGMNDAVLAALEALEEQADQPLSLKELKQLEKKKAKEAKQQKQQLTADVVESGTSNNLEKKSISKALNMKKESSKQQDEGSTEVGGSSNKSKKEAKLSEKKKKKKVEVDEEESEVELEAPSAVSEEASIIKDDEKASAEEMQKQEEEVTLEDRIRKERPPPRIRVMEGVQPGYVSLRLEDVSVTFRNQHVLKSVTWGVETGDRVGLVGANGGGKTTQLRILSGEMEPTSGDVVKSSKDLRVSILRQEFVDELDLERPLFNEFMSVFSEENQILLTLREVEAELEQMTSDAIDADRMQQILDRMADLQAKADAREVYALDSRVQKVMDLMGFTPDESKMPVKMFSGGWKMRIGLGKVLLKDPNVLLLDEPTNHLDLESVEWLEDFLRNQNIPMVIVSHDREFLDQICTKIVDVEGGIASEYDGNYSKFLQLKKARMDAWNAAYNAQEKRIKEERAWINKFRDKQPVAVKQREAKLEKLMSSKDYVQKPPFIGKPFRFRFPDAPRLSPEVAEIMDLTHGYGNNRLFDKVQLFIGKGDRIAVVGPNGSGKSTLLRFLTGKEQPDGGSAALVGLNVVANYFEQNQADVLDLDLTVSETIQRASNGQSYNELRALLGQFLFKGDAVDKKVGSLSGGEKARLSLCTMMLRPANVLILGELYGTIAVSPFIKYHSF
jgi:ATP-binding cassette subfamily F protein 3